MRSGGGKSAPRRNLSSVTTRQQLSRLAAPFFHPGFGALKMVAGLIVVWRAQLIAPPDATILAWTGIGILLILVGIADLIGFAAKAGPE